VEQNIAEIHGIVEVKRCPGQKWRRKLKIVWCCGVMSTAIFFDELKANDKNSFSTKAKVFSNI